MSDALTRDERLQTLVNLTADRVLDKLGAAYDEAQIRDFTSRRMSNGLDDSIEIVVMPRIKLINGEYYDPYLEVGLVVSRDYDFVDPVAWPDAYVEMLATRLTGQCYRMVLEYLAGKDDN